jgi:hypothetical protein
MHADLNKIIDQKTKNRIEKNSEIKIFSASGWSVKLCSNTKATSKYMVDDVWNNAVFCVRRKILSINFNLHKRNTANAGKKDAFRKTLMVLNVNRRL